MSFLLHSTVTSLKGWFPYDFFLVCYNKWEFNNCLLGWVLSTETYWRNIRSCIYQECHMGPLMQKGKWQPGPSLVRGKSLIQLCFKWPWSLLCWLLFLVSNGETRSGCHHITEVIDTFQEKSNRCPSLTLWSIFDHLKFKDIFYTPPQSVHLWIFLILPFEISLQDLFKPSNLKAKSWLGINTYYLSTWPGKSFSLPVYLFRK